MASAQTFPSRTVRITSPFPAGSGADAAIRIVVDQLQAAWQQPVVVDPKPGASGIVAVNALKMLPADGHELLAADVGTLTIAPYAFKKLPYDPTKDFVPICLINRAAVFIAVGGASPFKTYADLQAAARTGSLSYASPGLGTFQQLGAEQMALTWGTKMLHVPFRDFGQLGTAVATGDVSMVLTTYASASALVKAGKVRLLAVVDSKRSIDAPEVPTLVEAGGPAGIEVSAWLGLVAPAGTPTYAVQKIEKSVAEVLSNPDTQARFAAMGLIAEPSNSDRLRSLMASETRRYGELIRRTGVSLD